MMGLPSPGLLAGVAVVAALAGYSFGTHVEHGARVAEVSALRAEHAEAVATAALLHAADIEDARQVELGLRADIDNIAAQRAKELEDAKIENDRVVADLRAGNRRLSIAVKSCDPAAAAGGAGAGAATATGPEAARADIDDAVAQRLVAIAREGDDAIRDLNTCIGAYEAVRRRINGAAR